MDNLQVLEDGGHFLQWCVHLKVDYVQLVASHIFMLMQVTTF